MIPTTRTREYREGKISRRRTYKCLECKRKFQVDTLNPLPDIDKYCHDCKLSTVLYTFISKTTGKTYQTRCIDQELATLRAWKVDPALELNIGKNLFDAALGEFKDIGFSLVEPDNKTIELYFKDKLVHRYYQTRVSIMTFHNDCRNFLNTLR